MVQVDIPKFYGPQYQGKLVAGASAVSLSDWCPYYYKLGIRLANLQTVDDQDEIIRDKMAAMMPVMRKVWFASLNSSHREKYVVKIFKLFPS